MIEKEKKLKAKKRQSKTTRTLSFSYSFSYSFSLSLSRSLSFSHTFSLSSSPLPSPQSFLIHSLLLWGCRGGPCSLFITGKKERKKEGKGGRERWRKKVKGEGEEKKIDTWEIEKKQHCRSRDLWIAYFSFYFSIFILIHMPVLIHSFLSHLIFLCSPLIFLCFRRQFSFAYPPWLTDTIGTKPIARRRFGERGIEAVHVTSPVAAITEQHRLL